MSTFLPDRNSHLVALRGVTHNGVFEALNATLAFARRYAAEVDFTSRGTAERDIERTNALMDPNLADADDVRLLLPSAA